MSIFRDNIRLLREYDLAEDKKSALARNDAIMVYMKRLEARIATLETQLKAAKHAKKKKVL